MKTRCLIVDDEPLAIKVIESHISKVPNLELVGSCQNAVEAFDLLLKKKIDLVFLDVEMPEISGVDLLKSLNNGPAVIFITAYRDFALDAFELDAIDYLLKPVSFERFFKAVSKYFQWKGSEGLEVKNSDSLNQHEAPFIYVRSDRKVLKILLQDILFIESLKDYVKIHLEGETIITKEKISNLEDKLPEDQFIRAHRSFLVASKYIKAFTSETIEVKNHEIPIGRTYKNSVLSFLGYKE
jgi:DNA-binding LytR/AlgR family response regulator